MSPPAPDDEAHGASPRPRARGNGDIIERLRGRAERLSPSERRIATVLLEETPFTLGASITELAERAGVSPPTVSRFCQRLGCQNFGSFKVELASSAFIGARFYETEGMARAPADVADNVVAKAQGALSRLVADMDHDAIARAATIVADARIVRAFGSGGASSMIALEAQNRLFRLGVEVVVSTDHTMQLMMAAACRPGDVILASSMTGANVELARAVAVGRERGAQAIAITRLGTPVAGIADLVVPVDIPEGQDVRRPTSARYGFLATLDVLSHLVALEREEAASATLRSIKRQLVAHRDGDDTQAMGD